MNWKLCRSTHQFGSLVSIESIFSCLWKLYERKYSTYMNILRSKGGKSLFVFFSLSAFR